MNRYSPFDNGIEETITADVVIRGTSTDNNKVTLDKSTNIHLHFHINALNKEDSISTVQQLFELLKKQFYTEKEFDFSLNPVEAETWKEE